MSVEVGSGPSRARRWALAAAGAAAASAAVVWLGDLARARAQLRATTVALNALWAAVADPGGTARARGLLRLAARELGVRAPHGSPVATGAGRLFDVAAGRLFAFTVWPVASVDPLVIAALVAGVVVAYWLKERADERLAGERRELTRNLLAITGGLGGLSRDAPVQAAVADILQQLREHTCVRSASVVTLSHADPQDALVALQQAGPGAPSLGRVPRAYLDGRLSLVGRAIAEKVPVYTGDDGGDGYAVPGTRLARTGIFPLRHQGQVHGLLLAESDEPGWFARWRDLLEVIAQEVAIVVVNDRLERAASERARYQEMARVRSEILTNVSHELRTPLGLIKGYAETLRDHAGRVPPAEQKEFLEVIATESDELGRLVENLLAMSRIETVGIELDLGWFSPDDLAQRLARDFPPALYRRVALDAGGVAAIHGDVRQIAVAVSNAVHNALKYASGEVRVAIFRPAPREVRVAVRDRGPGVPDEDLGRIFERFYRSARDARSEVRGSGLGLSIARRVLEAHGGSMWAHNRPEGGLEVCMQWPQPGDGDAAESRGAGPGGGAAGGRGP